MKERIQPLLVIGTLALAGAVSFICIRSSESPSGRKELERGPGVRSSAGIRDTPRAGNSPVDAHAPALTNHGSGRNAVVGGDITSPKPTAGPTTEHANPETQRTNIGASDRPPEATGVSVSSTPLGVRLAPDVRLPVAAMPVDFKMSAIAGKALKTIVDDYYCELAAGLTPTADHDNGTGPQVEVDGNGGRTIVVTNGPLADAARKRADFRFKALFGNAAYNRMTINSTLESRLPVADNE